MVLFDHKVSGREITGYAKGRKKEKPLGVNNFKRRWRVGYNGG